MATSASSGSASAKATTGSAAPELCVTVQRSQTAVARGKTATYVVQVSTTNGSASGVSVALTAQPSSQKPTFTSGCAKGDGTASCSVGSMTANQTVSTDAQIPVASNATSVTSVKLTATASVSTTAKWTPPAAAETTAVTAASASASKSASASASAGATHVTVLPLGPVPGLNSAANMLPGAGSIIGAGNASALFPAITPSAGASPGAPVGAQPGKRNNAPDADASPVSASTPVFTAQVAGLIALGVAIMLTVTRLTVRRRPSKPRG